jgi:hypothetical protein
MRWSDAGLHCRQMKLILFQSSIISPGFTEDVPTRDRSNRRLDAAIGIERLKPGSARGKSWLPIKLTLCLCV